MLHISSSILKSVTRFLSTILALGVLTCTAAIPLAADENNAAKAPDAFFAGAVAQFSSEAITVGRIVRGKAESRTFGLTPQTKIEGKLAAKVRVTVRYVSDDDGDTATLIVVRGSVPKPPKQKKK